MNLKADCINEQIGGLHSTYHCGVGKCAKHSQRPIFHSQKFGFQKKKKSVWERENCSVSGSAGPLYRKQKQP